MCQQKSTDMHELGIAFYLIDMVEDLGKQNNLTSVARVKLQLGEVSGVVPTYLLDVWRWAADRTELLHGAQLEIEEVPALTQCLSCNETYATVTYGRTCPYCSSEKTELIQGLEIELAEIEAS